MRITDCFAAFKIIPDSNINGNNEVYNHSINSENQNVFDQQEPSLLKDKKEQIGVYPVPATDKLNLACDDVSFKNIVSLKLLDITGSTNNHITDTQTVVVIFQEENTMPYSYTKNSNLLIFPNPTNSSIFVRSSENISDIWVYNQLDELIINLSNINNTDVEVTEVETIKSGIYILQVKYFNGGVEYRKFIKI